VTFEELKKRSIPYLPTLVPKEVLEHELQDQVVTAWHVFFFKSVPDREVAAQVDSRFRSFLNQNLIQLLGDRTDLEVSSNFDATGPYFEIQFPTPVTNHQWADLYRAFIMSVHRELSAIETYQGRRFEV
jgi:hypothetical protein